MVILFFQGISNMLDAGIISQGDDLDNDGEPDHLVETRHKIDDYLAKQVRTHFYAWVLIVLCSGCLVKGS